MIVGITDLVLKFARIGWPVSVELDNDVPHGEEGPPCQATIEFPDKSIALRSFDNVEACLGWLEGVWDGRFFERIREPTSSH